MSINSHNATQFAQHYTLAGRYLMDAMANPSPEFGFAWHRATLAYDAAANACERMLANNLAIDIENAALENGWPIREDDKAEFRARLAKL